MKRYLLISILLTLSFLLKGQVEFPKNLSMQEKLFRLGVIHSEVKQNFVNFDKLEFFWDSLYKQSIVEVINTQNDWEYYLVLKKFMAKLKDGHTQIVADIPFVNYCDYPVVNSTMIDGRYYITWTRELYADSIILGSELIKINGEDVDDYIKENTLPYVSASTNSARWRDALYTTLWNRKDLPYNITIRRKTDNSQVTLNLPRNGEEKRDDINNPDIRIPHRSSSKPLELNWLIDSIAHLSINTFNERRINEKMIDSIITLSMKAKGLVVDLRRNGGGSTSIAKMLLNHIIKDDYYLTYGWETRINDAVRKAMGYGYDEYKNYYMNKMYRIVEPDTVFIPNSLKRLNMPMVILVGQNTYSAAEDFLMMIYEVNNRPIIIGEETGGSTGAPLVIQFEEGVYARICTRRQFFPYSKKLFIGEGIIPDIEIFPSIDDLMEGKDIVLERGVEEVRKLIEI